MEKNKPAPATPPRSNVSELIERAEQTRRESEALIEETKRLASEIAERNAITYDARSRCDPCGTRG